MPPGGRGNQPLAYTPPKGYLRNFTYDKLGNVYGESPEGIRQQLNGLMIDAKSLPKAVKQTGRGQGGLYTPDYTQGGALNRLSFDNTGNLYAEAGGQRVAISGYQSDPNAISRSQGVLPANNNAYVKYDGDGLFVEVQTNYGGNPITAAYARQALQEAKVAEGGRLSRKSGRQTSTLGGAPTSTAAGSQLADEINLRNRKGTLIT